MEETKHAEKNAHELSEKLTNELAVSNTSNGAPVRIKHVVNIGDLYAAMGAMKKYWELTGRQVIVSQRLNFAGQYYAGAIHPTVDENGVQVCMNQPMWEMLKPLVESQPYIHSFEKYEGQEIHLDFDTIRNKTNVNLPHGAIQQWIPLAFPDLCFDMTKAWISIDDNCPENILNQVQRKIILNFTERYRNNFIEYFFLQHYAPDLIFAGTEKEHWLFCTRWNVNIPRLQISNFLELAYALKFSRFMLGCQSQCWNLAEALKTPRLLEIFPQAPNCQMMVGDDSVGFLYQVGVEFHFRNLYNKTFGK